MRKTHTADAARFRFKLLASVTGLVVAASGAAAAESPGSLIRDIAPQGGQADTLVRDIAPQNGQADTLVRDVAPQIVIAAPGTPTTARDPVNVTGVGQMIVDEQNGFIGLCTGTLINPRTVILAAHCVNERAANAYGQNSGGQPIGFGFSNNNNLAGNSAFGLWLSGAQAYQTNTGRFMYDANYVAYNPLSLEPNAASFLYGDIALASLDTPAANVPTWALLFSALTAPASVGASGTGYHVVIDGYGNNGTGITGSTGGIDYRRRIAENFLGGLTSLDAFENWLFGGAAASNPQNLYWIDFDDPRRGTASPPSVYDFNVWRDNALPNEGITASGDSGGPLILDAAYARQVVIGVLSGGYTRFFSGQPANGYGTASFYQPLYLYWDWIAANNPYHYVSAVAGNGAWTDPAHWITNLDPNYTVVSGGVLVNGIPNNPGVGNALDVGSRFGQECFQSGGSSDCLDHKTGVETFDPVHPIGTVSNDAAYVSAASLTGEEASNDAARVSMAALLGDGPDPQDEGGYSAMDAIIPQALPAATLANGLPGATNFVPNNFDGNRLTSTAPRYFDVTLSAAGTTTLGSAVTVDRFTISGASARLDISAAGSLTSLMAINHLTGTVNVNGALSSPGDYLLLSGLLSGTGTITVPFFTNMLGSVAPGTVGTTGTLTFNGNTIFTSGGAVLIDLGANGVSDRITVNGQASLGGALGFAAATGSTIQAGNTYTILTATGGRTGTFTAPTSISAILSPNITYTANSVTLAITAGLYANVINPADPVQVAFANLLDQNRPQQGVYPGLYGPLDMSNAATIRAQLDGLAPAAETTLGSIGDATMDAMAGFFEDRLATLDPSDMDGSVALMGNPAQLAELSQDGMMNTAASAMVSDSVNSGGATVLHGRLPAGMRAFIAGGVINGDSASMAGVPAGGRDKLDGWYGAVGLESRMGDNSVLGAAVSYSKVDGTGALAGQDARGELIQVTAYGNMALGALKLDGELSVGGLETRARRSVVVGTTVYHLTAQDDPMAVSGEVGLSTKWDLGMLSLTPRAAVRASHLGFNTVTETGGAPAMTYYREAADSLQGRLGFMLAGTGDEVQPYLNATFVHDFDDSPASFGANFAGGVGAPAIFALNGDDTDWAEIGVGLTVHRNGFNVSLGVETQQGRDDVEVDTFRGSATFRF